MSVFHKKGAHAAQHGLLVVRKRADSLCRSLQKIARNRSEEKREQRRTGEVSHLDIATPAVQHGRADGVVLLSGNFAEYTVGQYAANIPVIEIGLALANKRIHLRTRKSPHKHAKVTTLHRIAHRDVYVPDVVRNRIEHRQQQFLVRKDNRTFRRKVAAFPIRSRTPR